MFSGSYPKIVSEKGQALMFSYDLDESEKKAEEKSNSDEDDAENNKKAAKRQRVELIIDLNDKMLAIFLL